MYYPYYLEHAMRRLTAREANQRFSEVLSAVETGEQVVITKRGKPVALMSPYPADALAAERRAAIDRMIAAMNEPVTCAAAFERSPATKCTSADELHVRHQHPSGANQANGSHSSFFRRPRERDRNQIARRHWHDRHPVGLQPTG
jgi:prevent-host-death family protein